MISSNVIKITNLKSIPILDFEDKVLGLRLVDDSLLNIGDSIKFKDYNEQEHCDVINKIDIETEFNYFVTIGNITSFKEFIVPMYCDDVDISKYFSHCYGVVLNTDTVDLIYYFDYEVDSYLSKSKYLKNYISKEGKCIYTMYIPRVFTEDYQLISQGNYSKTTSRYKSRVLSFFLGRAVLFTNTDRIISEGNNPSKATMYIEEAVRLNAIFMRSNTLRELLEKKLNVSINKNQELYTNPQWQKNN